MTRTGFIACTAIGLASCAPTPMTLARADALCRDEIRGADGISGSVGVGVGSGGARAKGSITIDSRVLNPQSEEEYLADCIARRMNGEPEPARVGVTLGGRV